MGDSERLLVSCADKDCSIPYLCCRVGRGRHQQDDALFASTEISDNRGCCAGGACKAAGAVDLAIKDIVDDLTDLPWVRRLAW